MIEKLDLTYSQDFPEFRKIDLYIPEKDKKGVLFFIHGGGWRGGNKEQWRTTAQRFAEKGYLCSSMNYRFAPDWNFPAQIQDVRLAIAYVKSKAGELGFPVKKITAIGSSSGGHLALLAATISPGDYLGRSDDLKDEYTQPKAIVAYCPVVSIRRDHLKADFNECLEDLLGIEDGEGDLLIRDGSPVERVKDIDCPVLILQGTSDDLTTLEINQAFHDELIGAKVDSTFIPIAGAKHGFGYGVETPEQRESLRHIDEFLLKHESQ